MSHIKFYTADCQKGQLKSFNNNLMCRTVLVE